MESHTQKKANQGQNHQDKQNKKSNQKQNQHGQSQQGIGGHKK